MNVSQQPPPHDIEAEKAVLGAMLLDPKRIFVAIEKLQAEHFYVANHQKVFTAMVELQNEGTHPDALAVNNRLQETAQNYEWLIFVNKLIGEVATSANIKHHITIVLEHYAIRRVQRLAYRILENVEKGEANAEQIITKGEDFLRNLLTETDDGASNAFKIAEEALEVLDAAFATQGSLVGLDTGFHALNNLTGGFKKPNFILIGARPSDGKTALGMAMITSIAKTGVPCGVFSIESSKVELWHRMIAAESEINLMRIVNGDLSQEQYIKAVNANTKLSNLPIHIEDRNCSELTILLAKIRRMVKEHGVKIVAIDYLQMVEIEGWNQNREAEVAKISRSIKNLAKELDIPIMVMAQLNRGVESRKDRKPHLADIRDSGVIEQDIDLGLLIYRPDRKNLDEGEYDERKLKKDEKAMPVDILIAKNRNGAVGSFEVDWIANIATYRNHEEEIPDEPDQSDELRWDQK